jgi:hypothetical protein
MVVFVTENTTLKRNQTLQDHINFLCDAESGLTDGCSKHLSAYRLFLSRFKELCSLTGNTPTKNGSYEKGV